MTELENKMEALRFEKEKHKADLQDKQKERDFKQEENRKDRNLKQKEGKKDRVQKYVDTGSKLYQSVLGAASKAALASANDPEWYNHYPQMLKDTATFGFRMPKGTEPRAIIDARFKTQQEVKNDGYPGMLLLPFIPTLGSISGDITDPINVASYKMYNYMRTKISGNTKLYQPADVARLMLMYDSIYSFMGSLYRMYSLVNQYKVENRYYNRAILLGILGTGNAVDAILSDPSRLRGIINRYAQAFSSIPFPKGFDYLTRHFWMCTSIFRDSPSVKASEYMFTPYIYYTWNSNHASLDPHPIEYVDGKSSDPFIRIEAMLSAMLSSVYTSSDIVNITNDILKTFSEAELILLPQIAENYTIDSIYSPEVLAQINNSTIFEFKSYNYHVEGEGIVHPLESLTVWQKTADTPTNYPANVVFQGIPDYSTTGSVDFLNPFGVLVGMAGPESNTDWLDRYAIFDKNFVVNVNDEKFTDPKIVAVATRCMASASIQRFRAKDVSGQPAVDPYSEFSGYFVDVVGSEILVNAIMLTMNPDHDDPSLYINHIVDGLKINLTNGVTSSDTAGAVSTAVNTSLKYFASVISRYAQFDWAPNIRFMLAFQGTTNANTYADPVIVWARDLEYYTIVNRDQMKNLHYTCLTSMFHHKQMEY